MATYQSLYRRYRPQRFDEVLGQDHITKALRNAVRDDRVGHAYLFSGPRGTGKTSTARILAKVLNCAAPVDGEPCGKCESCVAVAEGRVTDWLLEQDAASKSKVDDMRDLLERVPLGTSGNRKVIILDEVHMLSQGAENALLKTLEEPPSHVVFVLATTDPQKVRPTIRSRTQHFEFRLLPPDLLADHVRHVIDDAGLGLDAAAVEQAIDHVIRSGGGSARDTLSALDQVAALGEVVDESQPVDAVLDALCERDPGQALAAVADALASGRDPRSLGEAIISALRDAFLSVMGAADEHLAPAERERAARVGERLGAPGLTRALDVLGEALVELSRKPDPRIVVEVALVRLTQPAADRTLDAVLERLDRLERSVASGTAPTGPAGAAGGASSPRADGSEPARSTGSARARSAGPAGAAGSESPGGSGSAGSARAARSSDAAGSADDPGPAGAAGASGAAGAAGTPGAAGGVPSSQSPAHVTSRAPVTDAADGRVGMGAAAARDALSTARGGGETVADTAQAAPVPAGRGSGQPTLGAVARGRRGRATGGAEPATSPTRAGSAPGDEPPGPLATGAAATDAPAAPSHRPRATTDEAPSGALPTVAELDAAWSGGVLAGLPVKIRSKWRGGRWAEPADGALRFAVPNAWQQNACDEFRREVEQALGARFGRRLPVTFLVEGDPARSDSSSPGAPVVAPPPSGAPGPAVDDTDEHIDPSELRDADDVATNGVDMLLREFGGGELLEEDQ